MRATYNASSRVNKNKLVLSNRRRRSELMGTGKILVLEDLRWSTVRLANDGQRKIII